MADSESPPTGRQRGVWVALAVVVVSALATGSVITTVLEVSDILPGDILTTLTRQEPLRDSGDLLITGDGPPTGVVRGIQLGLLGLLLGGVPATLVSAAMAAYGRKSGRRWSSGWGPVFLAGFVFQLSSLVFTTLLLVLVLFAAREIGISSVKFEGALLAVSLLCGGASLRFWRELQLSVHHDPVRITP